MSEEDQSELALRMSADLAGCFEQLMEIYQDRLYAFALRLSGNTQDAEEIVQDAFVRAYHALPSYSAERIRSWALRPWLYRITLNIFRNRLRGKRWAMVSMQGQSAEDIAHELAAPESERPEEVTTHAELQRALSVLPKALPEHHRVAVILRYVAGLTLARP